MKVGSVRQLNLECQIVNNYNQNIYIAKIWRMTAIFRRRFHFVYKWIYITPDSKYLKLNTLTAEGFLGTVLFMQLSNHVFRNQWLQKYLCYEAHFKKKRSKFNGDSKNAIKKQQNVFSLLNNCIWIGSGKISLLWQNYLPPAVKVLTVLKSKIWLRMTFYDPIWLKFMKKSDKIAFLQISAVFLGLVNTLTAERLSETGPFMHK